MKKRKLLICGGTGFIGNNLCSYFSQDQSYEVYTTYRNKPAAAERCANVVYVKTEMTNRDDVNRAVEGMDVVIQAAATTSGAKDIVNSPYLHVTDNAIMNALLFRACYEHKIRHVVFLSCTTMYQQQDEPVREEDFCGQMHEKYFGGGWTKVYHEKMCEFYARIGEAKYTVIRHSNIYGPHDKFDLELSHVFGATMTKVMTARDGKIVVWGDGTDERDFLYVDDLTDFIATAVSKQEKSFELLNLGLGESVSVKDLVAKMIEHSGRDLKVEFDLTKPSIGFKLRLNIDKAKSLFGWEPNTSLDAGIKKTLDWYREHQLGEQVAK
ncbi:MAG: NAD-dependent epimerase/dehydratase family protein [Candidatus Omnitrophota bacterium]|nr:NAD-dependent epimerase/dehydratase family protein [Candidatus Omnitrophota bacterium]